MKQVILVFLVLFSVPCFAQQKINTDLKKELESILFKDQIFREYIDSETTKSRKDSISKLTNYSRAYLDAHAWTLINKTDSANLVRIEEIISKFGYPGKSLVGEPANTTVFFVIQHSAKIGKYYPIIEQAGKKGEVPFRLVAMMLDRKLMGEGKEQVYGTQVVGRRITDKETGKEKWINYVQPIQDAKNVNKRRKEAGFNSTVEENSLRLGVTYKEYTLDEVGKFH